MTPGATGARGDAFLTVRSSGAFGGDDTEPPDYRHSGFGILVPSLSKWKGGLQLRRGAAVGESAGGRGRAAVALAGASRLEVGAGSGSAAVTGGAGRVFVSGGL